MPLLNPFAAYRVSGTWRVGHSAVDYATPIGTPVLAPDGGVYVRCPAQLARKAGQAGVWGYLRLPDGRRIVFCHLERHVAADGQRVSRGDLLATTGNSGYVLPSPTLQNPHLGAHMHTYGLTAAGTRWNWTLEAAGPAPAVETTPIPTPIPIPEPAVVPEEDEDDMNGSYTVHARAKTVNGEHDGDWTLGNPERIGLDLPAYTDTADPAKVRRTIYSDGKGGVINEYRGFLATNIQEVYLAWARTWARGGSRPHSTTPRDPYRRIQIEISRLAGPAAS